MPDQRTERRENRRAFRPTLDGTLETRVLMAQVAVIRTRTAAGGQAVVVTATDGARFFVSVNNGGTVRATPSTRGRVNLIVEGTTAASNLEINRIIPNRNQGSAHRFNPTLGNRMPRLNIASVQVVSGTIGAIEGYQTANLSGAIVVAGTERVDRIALNSILAGGSITTGGDINTLDVLGDVTLSGGTGIAVGRDLNWFQTFGNVNITNNANFVVGRDVGTTTQPPKGSGNAGQGIYVGGNVNIDPGSTLRITRGIANGAGVLINGNFSGATRIAVGASTLLTQPGNFFNFDFRGNLSA